jgi:hypothetical protein
MSTKTFLTPYRARSRFRSSGIADFSDAISRAMTLSQKWSEDAGQRAMEAARRNRGNRVTAKLYTWEAPPDGEPHWLAHPIVRTTANRIWIGYCGTALEMSVNRAELDETGLAHIKAHRVTFYAEDRRVEFEPALRKAFEKAREEQAFRDSYQRVEAAPVLGLSGPATREEILAAWRREISACPPGSDRRRRINSARNRAYAQLRAQGGAGLSFAIAENAQ